MALDEIKEQLRRMERKQDRFQEKVDGSLKELTSETAENTKQIAIHIEGVNTLKQDLKEQKEAHKNFEQVKFKPVSDHVAFMRSSWKLITLIGAFAAIVLTFQRLGFF